jgi:hypothetical protein
MRIMADKKEINDGVIIEQQIDVPLFIRDLKSLTNLDTMPEFEVGDRCYSLLGGRVVFGLQLGELPDSFLVALPATLHSEDGGETINGKLLTASPVIRLMKNGVAFMTIPEVEHQYHYFKFIRPLEELLPGYFNQARSTLMDKAIELYTGKPASPAVSIFSKKGVKELTKSTDDDDIDELAVSRSVPYSRTTRH